jgi:hypothetical protein
MAIKIGSCFLRNGVFLKVVGKESETGEFKTVILMPDRVVSGMPFSKRALSDPGEYTKIPAAEMIRYKNYIVRKLRREIEQGPVGDKKLNFRSLKSRLKDIEKL